MGYPVDPIIVGDALNTKGFEAYNTVSGLGLNTFGFLWGCSEIWQVNDPTITTTWTFQMPPNATVSTCTD